MASTPIKLGSAAGTALVFQTGSKITTSTAGIQSCSIQALYGDGQNIWSVLPVAGTQFNEIFGNSYLPSDFKVDVTGGGFDIDYIEGKAARVTINFKRPDPTQEPGPLGQRSRKVSVDTAIVYKSLISSMFVGLGGTTAVGGTPDEGSLTFGMPEPVVTVTYNVDQRPQFIGTTSALFAQPWDPRAADFPEVGVIQSPMTFPAFTGSEIVYNNNGTIVTTGPLTADVYYTVNVINSPNPLGWRLEGIKWEPHADESFFDVTETWKNHYSITGTLFGSIIPI